MLTKTTMTETKSDQVLEMLIFLLFYFWGFELKRNIHFCIDNGTGKNRKQTCEANAAGENRSFIFTVCLKSLPLHHLSLPMWFYIRLRKNFSKPTSEKGEINHFNRSLLIELFQLTLKLHSFIPSNMKSTRRIFIHT